jgi:hypothetical protein
VVIGPAEVLGAPRATERRSARRLEAREETRFDSAEVDHPPRAAATPASATGTAPTDFRPGESLVVTMGALAAGGMIGMALFFMVGRVAPWALLAMGFALYCWAIYLASLNMRDLIHIRAALLIALFGLHLTALLAWPLLISEWTPASWQWWLGLPASLSALVAFLTQPGVPNRVVYRSCAHGALIAGVALYEYMWRAMAA